jgi:anti-sigma factor RsiW
MTSSSQHSELRERGHEKYVELCALYGSGELSASERMELREHLAGCEECKRLLADYRRLVRDAIPLLANESDLQPANGFARGLADTKAQLFAQLEHGVLARNGVVMSQWHRFWNGWRLSSGHLMRYAAVALLIATMSFGGYMLGRKESARVAPALGSSDEALALRKQLDEAVGERDSLRALVEERNQELRATSAKLERQEKQFAGVQQQLDEAAAGQSKSATELASLKIENTSLKAEHEGLSRRFDEAQSNIVKSKQALEDLESEHVALQVESATKQRRVEELSVEVSEQQRLLAADRDIRELMGARDLLISDVLDIDRNGRNKKPFGRIFYTKNQKLIFYAFDLDKQPGLKSASAFQVWGARATSRGNENPVSMGIFYMDNATSRRWKLQVDNPRLLEQIDSVFVTVEPEGGSNKPSGKQLLFTYLRGEANHP